jgi:hypothetical protein
MIILSGCITQSPTDTGGKDESEGLDVELPSSYHYRIEFSSSEGDSGKMEVWVEDGQERVNIEDKKGIFTILKTIEGICIYDSTDGFSMSFPLDKGESMNPAASLEIWFKDYYYGGLSNEEDILNALQQSCGLNPGCDSVKNLGHDKVAGVDSLVIEMVYTESSSVKSAKMWFATDSGYLVKVETMDADGKVQTIVFTDIEVDKDIPDSVFIVPECDDATSLEDVFADMREDVEGEYSNPQ